MRRVLRWLGALGLGAIGLLAVGIEIYRPHSWRSASTGAVPPGLSDPARLKADVASFPPFRSRSHAVALEAMETLVRARLEALGWQVAAQDVRSNTNPRRARASGSTTQTLLATRDLAGDAPRVLLGAHLDSVAVSPGADDNGSGVAVLLELARVLPPGVAKHVELCFFNEEEDGLFGSFTFVASLSPEERKQIRVAYVMDMVGAYDSQPGSQTYPPPLSWLAPNRGDFLSVIALNDADLELKRLHAARDQSTPALPLEVLEAPRGLARQLPDLWRSDHAPFWEAGIPAVFLTDTGEFRSSRYHTPRDTAEALDYVQMGRVVDLLVAVTSTP